MSESAYTFKLEIYGWKQKKILSVFCICMYTLTSPHSQYSLSNAMYSFVNAFSPHSVSLVYRKWSQCNFRIRLMPVYDAMYRNRIWYGTENGFICDVDANVHRNISTNKPLYYWINARNPNIFLQVRCVGENLPQKFSFIQYTISTYTHIHV